LFIVLFLINKVNGQDIHFTQFNQSPINLNPSLTGNFNAKYRLVGNYRNQWNTVGEGYATYAFSAEGKNLFKLKRLSYGVQLFQDEAGVGNLIQSYFALSINYSQNLNYDSTLSVSIGTALSYQQSKVEMNNFSFDRQYISNSFNPNNPTGEDFGEDRYGYFNPSVGAHVNYAINSDNAIKMGVAFHNLLRPKNSFFKNDEQFLETRTTFHFSSTFLANQMLDIQPTMLYMMQGEARELVLGTNFRYYVEKTKYAQKALTGGIFYRNKDAAAINIGLELTKTAVSFSYDIVTSAISEATNRRGGLEISIVHLINNYKPHYKRGTKCPNFM
jgi:type IX secretion system PorP/SprF family membrane protein